MITIVDYGMGNLGSVENMFKKVGAKVKISSDLNDIKDAYKIILPGVGHFDNAMNSITQNGMLEVLEKKALFDKIPVLGICLGMQLLTESSEEGKLAGLGWVPAKTLSFKSKFKELDLPNKYRVPHMGWNEVFINNECPLLEGVEKGSRYYFVHSFFVRCKEEKNSILKSNYGFNFDVAIRKDNIYGVQFHPEKSHRFGMRIFDNFYNIL